MRIKLIFITMTVIIFNGAMVSASSQTEQIEPTILCRTRLNMGLIDRYDMCLLKEAAKRVFNLTEISQPSLIQSASSKAEALCNAAISLEIAQGKFDKVQGMAMLKECYLKRVTSLLNDQK